MHRKYNPSSRLVLYGCAAASVVDQCTNRTTAGIEFEWGQVHARSYFLTLDAITARTLRLKLHPLFFAMTSVLGEPLEKVQLRASWPLDYLSRCFNLCSALPQNVSKFQVDTDLSYERNSFRTEVSNPTLVVHAGVLSPGRQYTFSITATNTFGISGYSGKHHRC